MRSPSPGLGASFNGKCCYLSILSTLRDAFHRVKIKYFLNEYIFKEPAVSVTKYHVQILALPVQSHQPPSEVDLHRFHQCPHPYPVPPYDLAKGESWQEIRGSGYSFSWLLLKRSPQIALSSRNRHCSSEDGAFHMTLSFQALGTVLCHLLQVGTVRP